MSAAALPYTVLMLLVELAVGSLAIATAFDARRMVTRGYVQLAALVVGPTALLAVLLARGMSAPADIDGYTLGTEWFGPLRVTLIAFLAVAVVYGVAAFAGHRLASLLLGGLAAGVGAVALVMLAGLVAPPAWSYAGVLASVLASALALGGTLMAMSWGHWYLTNSGLPKEPLEQMSLLAAGALLLQALLLLVGAAAPVREIPLGESTVGVGLAANPAFWLRVLVGVAFPLGLAVLAYKAASIRGMMSATGLLYIATGAVLAGEVLARGLLFATGAAV